MSQKALEEQESSRQLSRIAKTYGMSTLAANSVAYDSLQNWSVDDFKHVFEKINGFSGNINGLQIVKRSRKESLQAWISWNWVKPDFKLVQEAANTNKALCVNKNGEFKILDSDFVALSHVWTEGLYADAANRGLPQFVMDQLFDRMKVVQDAEWIWLDSLAVPGGARDLSVLEEKVKVELINNMGDIYGKASAVVVLDALVLSLQSNDPIDVAIAILCGRWRTRMWTFQETRLASNVRILTGKGSVGLQELVDQLKDLDWEKKPSSIKSSANGARSLTTIISALLPMIHTPQKLTLKEVFAACFFREAGFDLDYARALFPMLGIRWNDKFTRERGMGVMYSTRKSEAVEFAFTYNAPRLIDGPGWACSYVNGINGEPLHGARWEKDGVKCSLHPYKIRATRRHEKNPLSMELEFDYGESRSITCWIFSCDREREKARSEFSAAVDIEKGVLLAIEPLTVMKNRLHGPHFRIVTLAKETDTPGEYQVFFTAKIFKIAKVYETQRLDVTLSHQSPFNYDSPIEDDNDLGQKFLTVVQEQVSPSKLHQAIVSSNLAEVHRLLESDHDLNASEDTQGWLDLHHAVILQGPQTAKIIGLLLDHGARVNFQDRDTKEPLTLAVERGLDETITQLIRYGARQISKAGVTPLNQALFSHRSPEIIQLLIDHGADVTGVDEFGRAPLIYSIGDHNNMVCLLKAGADPSVRISNGRTALHMAANRDLALSIEKLVEFGAPVDILEKGDITPLYYAIIRQNPECVRALLKHQANTNRRFKDGWTVLMHAVQVGHFGIVESLLESHAQVDVMSTEEKWTPVHIAVQCGHSRILNLLLEQPSSLTAVWRIDGRGLTARALAEQLGNSNMSTILARRMKNEDPWDRTLGYATVALIIALIVLKIVSDGVFWPWSTNYIALQKPKMTWMQVIFSMEHFPIKFIFIWWSYSLVKMWLQRLKQTKLSEEELLQRAWQNKADGSEYTWSFIIGLFTVLTLPWYGFRILEYWTGSTIAMAVPLLTIIAFWGFVWDGISRRRMTKREDVQYYEGMVASFAMVEMGAAGFAYLNWIKWWTILNLFGSFVLAGFVAVVIYSMNKDLLHPAKSPEEPAWKYTYSQGTVVFALLWIMFQTILEFRSWLYLSLIVYNSFLACVISIALCKSSLFNETLLRRVGITTLNWMSLGLIQEWCGLLISFCVSLGVSIFIAQYILYIRWKNRLKSRSY